MTATCRRATLCPVMLINAVIESQAVPYGDAAWGWVMAGALAGLAVAALITALLVYQIMRRKVRRAESAAASAVAFRPPRPAEPAPGSAKTQKIDDFSASAVSPQTLENLRQSKEIHELSRTALEEVIREALSTNLDAIGDDILREKIVRCVLGPGLAKLLPRQADALWGCVLSWDPCPDDLEKQTTDLLSWSFQDCGQYDDAEPVVDHSRHNIAVPEDIQLSGKTVLAFDRRPNTLLGEGASAGVFKAHIAGHPDVAVKISRLADYGILRNTLLEYLMLRRAQGIDGVIRLYGAGGYHVGEEVYFLIVEELAETTLASEFERRKAAKEPYSETELRDDIVKPLLATLAGLHERGIIHRDLKPKNIYRVGGAYKIGDFEIAGYSRDMSRGLITGTFAGSPAYTTAGALEGRYGPETDINALACIGYMMLRGDLPAIEDAPGTSTLVRGIRGGAFLTEDDKRRQEKAKKAVQEWLALKRGFITQIRHSLRSTPFERFFIAPILSQGLYAEATPGSIRTAEDAFKALSRIELSEEAQEIRRKALELAKKGDFETAKKMLVEFDARFNRRSPEEIEVSMHVMIGDALREIDDWDAHPAPALVLPFDNAEMFADGRPVDNDWRYYENDKAVGHKTDAIGRVSRDGRKILTVSLRIREDEADLMAQRQGSTPGDLAGKFRIPDSKPGVR